MILSFSMQADGLDLSSTSTTSSVRTGVPIEVYLIVRNQYDTARFLISWNDIHSDPSLLLNLIYICRVINKGMESLRIAVY